MPPFEEVSALQGEGQCHTSPAGASDSFATVTPLPPSRVNSFSPRTALTNADSTLDWDPGTVSCKAASAAHLGTAPVPSTSPNVPVKQDVVTVSAGK